EKENDGSTNATRLPQRPPGRGTRHNRDREGKGTGTEKRPRRPCRAGPIRRTPQGPGAERPGAARQGRTSPRPGPGPGNVPAAPLRAPCSTSCPRGSPIIVSVTPRHPLAINLLL